MKKTKIAFLFLISSLFVCCSKRIQNNSDKVIEKVLLKVYPVIYENVDSADSCLHEAQPFLKDATEHYRNRYLLAAYQVRNNRWEPLQFTDTLNNLVEYVMENGDTNEKMRACYLTGRCFERSGDYLTALEWMQQGWEIAKNERGKKDFDYSIASYIGSKIGFLLTSEHACMLAKDYFMENAANAVTRYDSVFALNDISRAYYITEQYDSARHYAEKAYEIMNTMPYDPNYFDIVLWNQIELFEECGDWEQVAERMAYVERHPDFSYPNFHKVLLARWYLHRKDHEKAENILRKTDTHVNAKNTFSILKAYVGLFAAQEQKDSAMKYAQLCIEYQDTVLKHSDLSQGHAVDRLYHINIARQKENEALKAKIRATWIAITTVFALMLLTFALLYLRKKYRQKAAALKDALKNKENDNVRIRKELKNANVKYQQLVYESIQNNIRAGHPNMSEEVHDRLRLIKKGCAEGTVVNKENYAFLREFCDTYYPNWEKTIQSIYPKISVFHLQVCMLTLLGFNLKMTANALDNQKQNISYSYKMLNKHIGNVDSSKCSELIHTLENICGPIVL